MILTDFGGLGFRGVFGGSWEEDDVAIVELTHVWFENRSRPTPPRFRCYDVAVTLP